MEPIVALHYLREMYPSASTEYRKALMLAIREIKKLIIHRVYYDSIEPLICPHCQTILSTMLEDGTYDVPDINKCPECGQLFEKIIETN